MSKRLNGAELALQAEEAAAAWEMYKSGSSIHNIATKLQQKPRTVARYIAGALRDLRVISLQAASEYRQVHLERIQAAIGAIWPKVLRGQIDAINTLIRLLERESKLLGLDAPQKVDLTGRIMAFARLEGITPEEAMAIAERVYKETLLLPAGENPSEIQLEEIEEAEILTS